jgi:hypothetical protein
LFTRFEIGHIRIGGAWEESEWIRREIPPKDLASNENVP